MDSMTSSLVSYEEEIILLMIDEDMTMSEALNYDMMVYGVDVESVIDMCDYLELRLDMDMDLVEFFMDICVGRTPDQILTID